MLMYVKNHIITISNLFCSLVPELCVVPFLLVKVLDSFLTYLNWLAGFSSATFALTASAIVLLPFDWPVEKEDIKLWQNNCQK